MKECAEQADRAAKQAGWIEGKRVGNGEGEVTIIGWQDHYSPKYERCYVHVTYINHSAATKPALPLLFDELYDAFERRQLSMCADVTAKQTTVFCTVQGTDGAKFDCHACREFVNDRMDK
jgi:hypothetical protein